MRIIGDATGRFIEQLKLFERVRIDSRLLGWGERWAFMEHCLIREDGQLAARVVIRGMFWSGQQGAVPVAELLEKTGHAGLVSPALPEWVQGWSLALDRLSESAHPALTFRQQ
jgi:hypothetical protein